MSAIILLFLIIHTSFVQSSKVITLTEKNFESKITAHPIVLVKFYAPWCGHCKKLAPEFISAADILSASSPPVALAEVDCTVEEKLCSNYGVSGYPTLKIFKNGKFDRDFEGPREASGIVDYMLARARPPSTELHTLSDLEQVFSEIKPVVVAYAKDPGSAQRSAFLEVASELMDHVIFTHTSNNIFHSDGDHHLRLYFPKSIRSNLEKEYLEFSGEFTANKFKDWIQANGHGLVGYRTQSNKFFFPESNLVVVYDKSNIENYLSGVKYVRNRMIKTLQNRPDLTKNFKFAYSFVDDHRAELIDFGIDQSSKLPFVTLRSSDGKKYILKDYSPDALVDFIEKYNKGQLTPYLKSEDIPTDQSSPVKKVVAANFDTIVNDPSKDVLVVFHAPWCGHCKNLMPKFEKAAEKLSGEPHVVLAAMDATANDVPRPYEVTGFPTIYFASKMNKAAPKRYDGGRETEDIIKYVAKYSTEELVGYDRLGNEKKTDL